MIYSYPIVRYEDGYVCIGDFSKYLDNQQQCQQLQGRSQQLQGRSQRLQARTEAGDEECKRSARDL